LGVDEQPAHRAMHTHPSAVCRMAILYSVASRMGMTSSFKK
jgi:hypothetical protein